MNKNIKKCLVLYFTIVLVFSIIGINVSYAAEASISVPEVKVGQDFIVTVNIPAEAVGYEGKISVTFSDGTVKESKKMAVMTGLDGDFKHPGNMTASFNAVKEGEATVKVTGLIISSQSGQINENKTLTKTISIASNKPPEDTPKPTTPSTPTTPTEPPKPETPPASNEPTWTETGDTVYALEDLNVRSGWGTSYDKMGTLTKNSSTKRISVGSNGWDKIEYNGKTGYVVSKYLTTQKPEEKTPEEPEENNEIPEPTWTETGDTVYALQKLNVRSGWGTSYKAIGSLKKDASTKRISVGSNGWDKIEYNGKIAYVMSKYLTTEKPEEKSVNNTIEDEKNNVINNTLENTNNSNTNVVNNGEIYNEILEEVGVIPPVGKNISDYIYIIAVCLSIAMVIIVGVKIREKNEE